MTKHAVRVSTAVPTVHVRPCFPSDEQYVAAPRRGGGSQGLCSGCALEGKPSSMQHQFFTFHSNILHTKRGQLSGARGPEGRILKANFRTKNSEGDTPFAGRGTPCCTHPSIRPSGKHPSAETQAIVPLISYGVHLCPSKNKHLAPPMQLS